MTYQEWKAKYPKVNTAAYKEAYITYPDPWLTSQASWDMHHLTDYVVTSFTGGVYWLNKRKEESFVIER